MWDSDSETLHTNTHTHLEIKIRLGEVLVQRRGHELRCHHDDAAETCETLEFAAQVPQGASRGGGVGEGLDLQGL